MSNYEQALERIRSSPLHQLQQALLEIDSDKIESSPENELDLMEVGELDSED